MSFGAELAAQHVTGLHVSDAGRVLTLADGSQAVSRTVVIATGVSYWRLPVPCSEALLAAGVFCGAAVTEAQAMKGQPVVVVAPTRPAKPPLTWPATPSASPCWSAAARSPRACHRT